MRSGRQTSARDDEPTTQTTNCIFGGLSHRHCKCRNRYIDSSKARTIAAVTVALGAPGIAAAALRFITVHFVP